MKLNANKIGWIAFIIVVIIIILSAMNPVINVFDFLTDRPLRPGQGAQVVETQPYILVSNQDTSKWTTYTSPEGFSFKYPSDTVEFGTLFPGSITSIDKSNQVRFGFDVKNDANPLGFVDALKYTSSGEIKVQDVTVGNISGKVVTYSISISGTSITTENFIFSLSNNRTLTFSVPLSRSVDIPHTIISTLALIK